MRTGLMIRTPYPLIRLTHHHTLVASFGLYFSAPATNSRATLERMTFVPRPAQIPGNRFEELILTMLSNGATAVQPLEMELCHRRASRRCLMEAG